jgi:hypothetical protein
VNEAKVADMEMVLESRGGFEEGTPVEE